MQLKEYGFDRQYTGAHTEVCRHPLFVRHHRALLHQKFKEDFATTAATMAATTPWRTSTATTTAIAAPSKKIRETAQSTSHAAREAKPMLEVPGAMIVPEAASEVDFDVSDPPLEPLTPASKQPICESSADLDSFDVLCGRGVGTNFLVGNRRFLKLVQEFQRSISWLEGRRSLS